MEIEQAGSKHTLANSYSSCWPTVHTPQPDAKARLHELRDLHREIKVSRNGHDVIVHKGSGNCKLVRTNRNTGLNEIECVCVSQ
jgi:hypothetical protein